MFEIIHNTSYRCPWVMHWAPKTDAVGYPMPTIGFDAAFPKGEEPPAIGWGPSYCTDEFFRRWLRCQWIQHFRVVPTYTRCDKKKKRAEETENVGPRAAPSERKSQDEKKEKGNGRIRIQMVFVDGRNEHHAMSAGRRSGGCVGERRLKTVAKPGRIG